MKKTTEKTRENKMKKKYSREIYDVGDCEIFGVGKWVDYRIVQYINKQLKREGKAIIKMYSLNKDSRAYTDRYLAKKEREETI